MASSPHPPISPCSGHGEHACRVPSRGRVPPPGPSGHAPRASTVQGAGKTRRETGILLSCARTPSQSATGQTRGRAWTMRSRKREALSSDAHGGHAGLGCVRQAGWKGPERQPQAWIGLPLRPERGHLKLWQRMRSPREGTAASQGHSQST